MAVQQAFWDYFWLAKLFFQVAGIFPIGGTPSVWKSALNKLLSTLPLLYTWYVIIPVMNYILFQVYTVDDLLDAVVLVISISALQISSIIITVNRRKIKRLFAICQRLWDRTVLADHKETLMWVQRARLFSTAHFCVGNLMMVLFAVTGVVKQLSRPENSTIRYYPFHYPEDSTPSPQYEIKYALQVIICYLCVMYKVAADMTGTLFALNMCGQFALIRNWLVDVSKKDSSASEENIESAARMLKKCIRRHLVVLDFCAEVEEVVHHMNLIQMLHGIYVVAIAGARLMQGLRSGRYIGSFLFTMCSLFFSCWPADNLSTASSEVAAAAYDVPWYDYSSRGKTTVAIMLMRSQRPVELTAGKFVTLSLETFSSIVSTSASYFMVLYRFS